MSHDNVINADLLDGDAIERILSILEAVFELDGVVVLHAPDQEPIQCFGFEEIADAPIEEPDDE